MARPMKPLVRSGGYYPSNRWTPLVYPGGYTTANGGGQPEPEAVLKTVTGSLIHITDALALPAEALTVNVEPIQAGTGDPSPDNVRPISGITSATVTRTGKNLLGTDTLYAEKTLYSTGGSPTPNPNYNTYRVKAIVNQSITLVGIPADTNFIYRILLFNPAMGFVTSLADRVEGLAGVIKSTTVTPPNDGWFVICARKSMTGGQIELGSTATDYEPYNGNTYTIALGDTVYGGTLDVTGGKMVVDRAMVDLGTLAWSYVNSIFVATLPSNSYKYASSVKALSDRYAFVGAIQNGTLDMQGKADCSFALYYNANYPTSRAVYVKNTAYTDAAAFKTAMDGAQLVYELANPIEITLTPTQIEMLLGENNLWSDAGDSTMTYYAEGNASTSEALGILLGGTYNNPGGADDASDDEALGILLGGS